MKTYWVAFDLDQTIGCFESLHPYLMVFFPDLLTNVFRAPYYTGKPFPKLTVSQVDKRRLAIAYGDFVKWMAVREGINKLLRPGILDVMNMLMRAKKKGVVGGIMIYSNNSNPYMLQFAADLIKLLMGSDESVFCPLVHWWHPLRNEEVRAKGMTYQLSHGPKTAQTIQAAFSAGYCRKYYVSVSFADILFFDDLVHAGISDIIPAQNYFHVQPYHHICPVEVINECFLNALMVNDLDKNLPLLEEFKKVGLSIGPYAADLATFRVGGAQGRETEVVDGDVILKRLSKLVNVEYAVFVPNKITVAFPAEKPFEKPTLVAVNVTKSNKRTVAASASASASSATAATGGKRKTRKVWS